MRDLIGKVVVVRDTTGYSTEGKLEKFEEEAGLVFLVLSKSLQVNYVDHMNGNKADGWEIPGQNRIAMHLVVGIHETHLGR